MRPAATVRTVVSSSGYRHLRQACAITTPTVLKSAIGVKAHAPRVCAPPDVPSIDFVALVHHSLHAMATPGTAAAESSASIEYGGEDLEILAALDRYRRWIIDDMTPHLAGHIAEIGAGIGTFTGELLTLEAVDHLDAVEPSARLAATLRARFAATPRVTVVAQTCEQWAGEARTHSYDTVVMINVLGTHCA